MMVSRFQSKVVADTFALVTFAFAVGMAVEVGISGLTIVQSLQSRLMAIPVNMITARPYGAYRDRVFALTGADRKGRVSRAAIDIGIFVSFMVPQYALILFFTGATFVQIIAACVSVTACSLVIGRAYGLYLGWCRGMFRVPVEA